MWKNPACWCLSGLICVASVSCSGRPADNDATRATASRPTPVSELPQIDAAAVLEHTKVLASDRFEGRAPGGAGEELTVGYLTDQFKKIGLKPGNTDGTYVQAVPLVGITSNVSPVVLKKGTAERRLGKGEIVAWTKHVAPSAKLADSELVFVGYGIVAPEYGWDDYKGLDVRGKTLVMLVNDPPVRDAKNPAALDPKVFGGTAMTYYGRWTYKFEIAAKKGAAGAIIIHETGPAGYPFDVVQSSWEGEQFDLVTVDRNMGRASLEGWVPVDQGRKLLEWAGQNYDALKQQAATPAFKPVPLGIRASASIATKLRQVASKNVLARLEGSDPAHNDECVVFTAHWDHLGIGPAVNGDTIYNGAKDNAVGTSGLLEIARAFTRLPTPPKRSILFMAVTAEEQGLLGSAYYAQSPVIPLAKTLAEINMDGLNVFGRTKDLTLIGYGASDLDDYAREAAAEQGRTVHADSEPEKGYYYRSDHFSFAKQGVPALDPDEGTEFIGKPEGYGRRVRDEYTARDYHKPSDEVRDTWDLAGAREDLQLFFAVGYRVAQAEKFPEWKPGNEFKAVRESMLSQAHEVAAWRAKHEADYTKEYVPLSGLFFLKPGKNRAGSAAGNDLVFPAGFPASIGQFTMEDGRFTFEADPSANVTLNGARVSRPVSLQTDVAEMPDRLAIGQATFWVHESGKSFAVRLHDPDGATAKAFAGYTWFPNDPRYRVVARFTKDPAPRQIRVASLVGDDQTFTTEGTVEFELSGQSIRMRPMTTRPGRLYFVFRDGTSGQETYQAARFLYSDLKEDGTTVLDFNMAYNPPCAFNQYTTCPLPLPENRLKVRIPAGERAYIGHE